jgi:hypothetical protein
MSNTITPTVFYRTLNVEGLEILYREAGFDDRAIVIDNAPTAAGSPYEAWKWQLCAAAAQCVTKNKDCISQLKRCWAIVTAISCQ